MRFFLRIKIADGIAPFYGAGRSELTGMMQDGFYQSGFARCAMPNQGDVTDGFGRIVDIMTSFRFGSVVVFLVIWRLPKEL